MASQLLVKKKRIQYSPENMALAIEAVRNGMAKNRASKVYSVPKTTLLDKLANRVPEEPTKPGPKPVLTKAEEITLVNYTNLMAEIGYPITRKKLSFEVKRLMDLDGRKTPFKDNLPGYDWYTSFMKRHPDLSERIPQALGHERAAISVPMVEARYDGLFTFLEKEVPNSELLIQNPRRIFNADESGFPLCMKCGKVLTQTGAKHVHQVVANTKQQITVMACFNALGDYVPPLIVYPGQRFRDTGIQAFPEAIYAHSENGWMYKELFLSFFEVFNTFVEKQNIEKPVILFVDDHSTHMTAEAARFCADNKIILYCLLPNATHVMQACDVGFFSPMKSAWRGNVKRWQMEH
ncbi:jerky protein homolog-like [Pecten maximus]|uniref:jerky protein homolog-like n=1 Tax=Pecten maximus TaxID=6579 RepID=UPI001457E767|nr:jerky protein homolog-like [Pecten maximus]